MILNIKYYYNMLDIIKIYNILVKIVNFEYFYYNTGIFIKSY